MIVSIFQLFWPNEIINRIQRYINWLTQNIQRVRHGLHYKPTKQTIYEPTQHFSILRTRFFTAFRAPNFFDSVRQVVLQRSKKTRPHDQVRIGFPCQTAPCNVTAWHKWFCFLAHQKVRGALTPRKYTYVWTTIHNSYRNVGDSCSTSYKSIPSRRAPNAWSDFVLLQSVNIQFEGGIQLFFVTISYSMQS